MRIVFMALGSRGDIQPALALAETLARRGHDVRFITHPGFAALAAGRGLTFLPLAEMRGELAGDEGKALFAKGLRPIHAVRSVVRIAKHYSREWNREFKAFAEGADILVGATFASFPATMLGRLWNIPAVRAFYQPVHATRAFPSAFLPALPFVLPGFANRLTHQMFNQLVWTFFSPLVRECASELWPGEPLPWRHPIRPSGDPDRPTFFAFSSRVIPRPRDWDGSVETTGYWFLDRTASWQPPQELRQFLDAGPPPVYVGFGSMGLADPKATAANVLDAVARCGCRVVLSAGWGRLAAASLPPHAFAIDDIPHDWLFPRMAAIVHHGGAGTTAAALRAGRPSVIVPFLGDQAFWARRAEALGVAPPALPVRALGPTALAEAIDRSLQDAGMRERAAGLGRLVEAENGTARAADLLERLGERRGAAACRGRGSGFYRGAVPGRD